MVVRIKTGKKIQGALSYNERKVNQGKAELILASRFGAELNAMGFSAKLKRFEMLNLDQQYVKTNTLHLSLNFSPYDKLDNQKMQEIAYDYMRRIGFGNQPYLVYRHTDAGHPHLHIVTTTIKPDGRSIKLHNIGKLKSEPARKEIEKEFDLIPAESMRKDVSLPLSPINLEKALYGEGETKSKVSNIVREVTSSYHFSSIDELNAILKQYNVVADTGRPGTRMQANKGLIYSMLDKNGEKTGIPVKASSIYTSPTLKNLEVKFEKEKSLKRFYTHYTDKVLEDLLNPPKKWTESQTKGWLARRKINYELIRDQQGKVIDVQFIDNAKKIVLRCADLNIQQDRILDVLSQLQQNKTGLSESVETTENDKSLPYSMPISNISLKLLNELLSLEYDQTAQTPDYLKKRKKRRKPKL